METLVFDSFPDNRRVGPWQSFKKSAARFLRHTQEARMIQVLGQMNDYQLQQIGITRADIASHAKKQFRAD